jgi:hypothetical protein
MIHENALLGAAAIAILLFNRKSRIGAIYTDVPEFYECNDGTFSTSSGARACHRHGGRKSSEPVQFGRGGSGLLNIQDVPLKDIHVNRELFQGREKAYSQRSVDNIVSDATGGRFQWENLDPITLWRSPEGKLYLLSGHSRLQAFKILSAELVKVDGKGFNRIPAKIRTGSLEQAQRMALESNTLSTKETDIERAAYYRRLRQDGSKEKDLLEQVKKNEGRNWANIYAYTFLSPSGRTWAALKQFAEGEDQSATIAKSLAKWIGNGRKEFPQLTNEHEGELYAWLFEQKAYGTGPGQVSSELDFREKLGVFVQKNTFFGNFDASKPLNILAAQYKSPAEAALDLAIQEKNKDVQQTERELKAKIKSLNERGANKSEVARIIAPIEAKLRNLRIELAQLISKKSAVVEYSKNEPTLFGIGRIQRRQLPHYF